MRLRPLDLPLERGLLLALWEQALGADWAVDADWFESIASPPGLYRPGDTILAEVDGQDAGFALTCTSGGEQPVGSLLAIGVLPAFRRRGIGKALHAAALDQMLRRGARRLQAGSGAGAYFWPGVPASLPDAWPFFAALGWPLRERSYDLVRSLDDYRVPPWVWQRVPGLLLTQAQPEDRPAVLEMVAREEPGWSEDFTRPFETNRASDVLLARREQAGPVLAACLVEETRRWAARFAGPVGAPACVLTAADWRDQGIGLALVARAGEILRQRGCRTSFIGWTWLTDWYGKLGYTVWQENAMSWRSG